jgi:hypothetical protein
MSEPQQVYRRRRAVALGVVAAVAAVSGALVGAGDGTSEGDAARSPVAARARQAPAPPELPRGGRQLFPHFRVVAFYGAPQADELGTLGIGTPRAVARRLARQARPYARKTRPVLPAMELIATIANAHPGQDGLYRTRQTHAVVRRSRRAARRAKALLVLDIQPGHADFIDEVRHFERWLREPDVGLALDPEWYTPGAQPGSVIGSVTAEQVNEVVRYVAEIVRARNLPEKLFIVHQFTADMIRGKERVLRPPGLAVTMNVDGFGNRANKVSKYREFTRDGTPFHHGYKLFYKEDVGLMSPRSVMALRPRPDVIVYE